MFEQSTKKKLRKLWLLVGHTLDSQLLGCYWMDLQMFYIILRWNRHLVIRDRKISNFQVLLLNLSQIALSVVNVKLGLKIVDAFVNVMVFLNTSWQISTTPKCLNLKQVISRFCTETKSKFFIIRFRMHFKMGTVSLSLLFSQIKTVIFTRLLD